MSLKSILKLFGAAGLILVSAFFASVIVWGAAPVRAAPLLFQRQADALFYSFSLEVFRTKPASFRYTCRFLPGHFVRFCESDAVQGSGVQLITREENAVFRAASLTIAQRADWDIAATAMDGLFLLCMSRNVSGEERATRAAEVRRTIMDRLEREPRVTISRPDFVVNAYFVGPVLHLDINATTM